MERKIIICLFFGGLIISISGQTPTLQIFDSDTDEGTEQGSSFTLNCTVTINDIILFKLNDTGQGSCNAPFGGFLGSCIPNTITQSFATSVTSWTISPAEPAHHGFWKCTRGSTDSIAEFLKIYKLPSTIDSQSGISSDIIVNDTSSYPILVDVDCMFSQNGPSMELQFVVGGTSSASVIMSCTTLSTACSPCTGCSAYSCRHTLILNQALSSGQITNDTPYTLKIKVGVSGTTQTFSNDVFAPHTITFKRTSKVSKEVEDISDEVVQTGMKGHGTGSVLHGGSSGKIQIYTSVTITSTVAELWLFSNQYVLCGTVVYGIQIVLVSAAINTVTIAFGVGVLVYYYGQYKCITILYFFLLTAASSIVGVLIYMLILIFFGNKDFIHIKFKNTKESKKLSALGMKLTNDNNICIYFKVKAINAFITLHITEHIKERPVGSETKIRKLEKVLRNGCPHQQFLTDHTEESNDLSNWNASYTEYKSFYLICENKTKTITVMDEKDEEILQWTSSADSFKIGDIEISNIKQDDSKKDDSTEKEQGEKLETPDEWIFWFRKGDSLCEIEEHEREIKEDLRFKQTLKLIFVIIMPIAWLVMICLIVRYFLKSKKEKEDDTELELKKEKTDDIKTDTKGKWFAFSSVPCCQNSVKPNSTKDNQPNAIMPGSYLANSPIGRNLPKLPNIVKPEDETQKKKKKDKKKKKIKNQDSNTNDKQQSHSLKQDITVQPVIAVAADELKAE